MKSKLLVLALLASGSAFAETRFSIGVNIGGYPGGYYVPVAPPPPPVVYYAPPRPGPDYVFVDGYYYPAGPRYDWRPGYWVRPPRGHAKWMKPRYHKGRYYSGYWR